MHLNPQEKLFESFFFIDNCQIAQKKHDGIFKTN